MLKVKNDNISIARGEDGAFQYVGVRPNGKPVILPVATDGLDTDISARKTYAVLAFTVKTGIYGDKVIEKYFDLEDKPMYDGKTDYTPGGYHKFTSAKIEDYVPSQALLDAQNGVFKVYNDNGTFVHIITTKDGEFEPAVYQFKFSIPIYFADTAELAPKDYVYDLLVYLGELTNDEILAMQGLQENYEFPLKNIHNKIQLMPAHMFTVEESNNV
jgi:hypothetical protein